MIFYFDTSVLIKRYVVETGSDEVTTWVDQARIVGSAFLTRVEMAAVLFCQEALELPVNWQRMTTIWGWLDKKPN